LSAWAILESDLREKPIFPVEPRDKLPDDEATRQQDFRKFLRWAAPTISSFGVPNAGKRGFTAQRKAKKEGLTAGAFDEEYAAPDAWLAILEWKDGTGPLSQEQIDWGNMMHRKGFRVACVRTPEFAAALFRQWGAPFVDRVGL
jgi:hypothetical protein